VKIGNIDFDAVIFDLDGTLYCNKGFKIRLITKSIKKIRIIYYMNKIRKKMMGRDFNSEKMFFNEFFSRIADKTGSSIKNIEYWYENIFYPMFIKLLETKYKGRENINELLKVLKKNNIKLVILSDYGHVEERLDALCIDKSFFDIIASNEEYGVLKPSKRPLVDIAEKLNIKVNKVLVVGDRDDTDGESARQAEMNYIEICANGKKSNENPGVFFWKEFYNCIISNRS